MWRSVVIHRAFQWYFFMVGRVRVVRMTIGVILIPISTESFSSISEAQVDPYPWERLRIIVL
jgi:hypothetical protein